MHKCCMWVAAHTTSHYIIWHKSLRSAKAPPPHLLLILLLLSFLVFTYAVQHIICFFICNPFLTKIHFLGTLRYFRVRIPKMYTVSPLLRLGSPPWKSHVERNNAERCISSSIGISCNNRESGRWRRDLPAVTNLNSLRTTLTGSLVAKLRQHQTKRLTFSGTLKQISPAASSVLLCSTFS